MTGVGVAIFLIVISCLANAISIFIINKRIDLLNKKVKQNNEAIIILTNLTVNKNINEEEYEKRKNIPYPGMRNKSSK
ncbi:MAG: hypothetical protein IKT33_03560 [Clostridia bacterium]|nr:hypothetical protein [Clostridia bacterium]